MNKRLVGTARYSSVHALGGYEQSRRDDMEGLCYVMVYFLKGKLPWQGLKCENKIERYQAIYEIKKGITVSELLGNEFPCEFSEFVTYCRNLRFEEEPNYTYLKGLIKCILINYQFEFDMVFDWNENKYHFKEDDLCKVKGKEDEEEIGFDEHDIIDNGYSKNNKIELLSQSVTPNQFKFISAVKGKYRQSQLLKTRIDGKHNNTIKEYLKGNYNTERKVNKDNNICNEKQVHLYNKFNSARIGYMDLRKDGNINQYNNNSNKVNDKLNNDKHKNNTNKQHKQHSAVSNDSNCLLF